MAYPYRVMLTEEQRAELRTLVGSGVAPARMLTRARILLKANHGEGGPGWADAAIAGALDVHPTFVNGGVIADLGVSSGTGSDDLVIVEADESDGTFELYDTSVALITNVDPDHLDHFGSRDALDSVFPASFGGVG